MAQNVDLEIAVRGDLQRFKFTFTQNGAAVDVTNWLIFYTLKVANTKDDGNAVLQIKHTAGAAGDDAANGIAYLVVPSTESEKVSEQEYSYDFQYVIPGTDPLEVHTVSYGKAPYVLDTTQATS